MTSDQDVTLGEINRSVDRIEKTVNSLALSMQAAMTLAAAQGVRIDTETKRTDALENKVDSLVAKSAYISGGIAALISAINFLLGKPHG